MIVATKRTVSVEETTYSCDQCDFQTASEVMAERHPGLHRVRDKQVLGEMVLFRFDWEEDLRACAHARALEWAWQGPGWYGEEVDGKGLAVRLMSLEGYFMPAWAAQMERLKPLLDGAQSLLLWGAVHD